MRHVELGTGHLGCFLRVDVELGVDNELSLTSVSLLPEPAQLRFSLELQFAVLFDVIAVLLAFKVQELAIEVL